MRPDSRLYQCANCNKQCVICSDCDRGNIYCSNNCASIARRKSCIAANQRYQKTFQGKRLHAARQRRYREALKQKVTDHGSNAQVKSVLLEPVKNEAEKHDLAHVVVTLRCCCCQKIVPNHLRRDFIQQHRRKSALSANTS